MYHIRMYMRTSGWKKHNFDFLHLQVGRLNQVFSQPAGSGWEKLGKPTIVLGFSPPQPADSSKDEGWKGLFKTLSPLIDKTEMEFLMRIHCLGHGFDRVGRRKNHPLHKNSPGKLYVLTGETADLGFESGNLTETWSFLGKFIIIFSLHLCWLCRFLWDWCYYHQDHQVINGFEARWFGDSSFFLSGVTTRWIRRFQWFKLILCLPFHYTTTLYRKCPTKPPVEVNGAPGKTKVRAWFPSLPWGVLDKNMWQTRYISQVYMLYEGGSSELILMTILSLHYYCPYMDLWSGAGCSSKTQVFGPSPYNDV